MQLLLMRAAHRDAVGSAGASPSRGPALGRERAVLSLTRFYWTEAQGTPSDLTVAFAELTTKQSFIGARVLFRFAFLDAAMFRFHFDSKIFCWSLVLLIGLGCLPTSGDAQEAESTSVRFATFNTSLYRREHGQLMAELKEDGHKRPAQIAEIIQTTRPDVILINEFDYDEEGVAARLFAENYLGKPQGAQQPIEYPHRYFASVNTGVDSGVDLNGDGKKTGTTVDAFGYGTHPGQYGMLVLSKFPIDTDNVRTFQKFLWKDMPDCLWPVVPETGKPYYSDEVKEVFRLSSKSHWDVPIQIGERTVHFLVSHPTPPVFDQEEDRNGCRNHDEIRLWADYVSPTRNDYIYDDSGRRGGLEEGAHFVIAGDLNADPNDGDSNDQAARQLTTHELINNEFAPSSAAAAVAAKETGRANLNHSGDPAHDTGDFNDAKVGNLRIDYVLPSKTLEIVDSGVFWPATDDPQYPLSKATDHRLVWIDIQK